MDNLSITILQIPLVWNNPKANRAYITQKLKSIKKTDLVILPETFTTGFAVEDLKPEKIGGETTKWLIEVAKEYNIAITGSVLIEEASRFYNRLLFVSPDGTIQYYNKWHLFSMGNEGKFLTNGTELPIFEYKNWRIKPIICYDLRFPITTRNTENYDLIICVANWPKPRIEAWDTLLKARAIENLAYCIGVNRVGNDPNGLVYIGHSNIYDPEGGALCETFEKESIVRAVISKNKIKDTKEKYPFLKDRDNYKLIK